MRLVICEKPSQAQAYAAVLNAKKRGDGFLEGDGCGEQQGRRIVIIHPDTLAVTTSEEGIKT